MYDTISIPGGVFRYVSSNESSGFVTYSEILHNSAGKATSTSFKGQVGIEELHRVLSELSVPLVQKLGVVVKPDCFWGDLEVIKSDWESLGATYGAERHSSKTDGTGELVPSSPGKEQCSLSGIIFNRDESQA